MIHIVVAIDTGEHAGKSASLSAWRLPSTTFPTMLKR